MILIVNQLSIFVENSPGKIGRISEILYAGGIKIEAMMITDAGEFGIIKLVLDNSEKAKAQLVKNGFTVSQTDVIIIKKEKAAPYDVFILTEALKKSNINVQYAYGFISEETFIVFKTSDQKKALKILQNVCN